MKKFLIWTLTLFVLVTVAGCENFCEKEKRPLNPTERAWIDKHPDGDKRSTPKDFSDYAIKDRCDPSLDSAYRWRRVVEGDPIPLDWPKGVNKPPVPNMVITYLGGDTFNFNGLDSRDSDGNIASFSWQLNYEYTSEEPEFTIDLDRDTEYLVVLSVTDNTTGTGGDEFKSGGSTYYKLRVPKIVCPEE